MMRANRRIFSRLFPLLIVGLCGSGWAEDNSDAAKPLPVLQYLGARATRMEAALPPLPDNLPAWQQRRDQVRRELAALLKLPAREPMRAKILASRTEGDVIVESVIYLWAERCYVPGIVARPPDSAGRLPALVVPPDFGGASKTLDEGFYRPFVYQMARKGYVVLFFDDPSFGDRKAPLAAWYASTSALGTQGMGVQVFDTLRGLDYLLTRNEVDPARIGVAGLCQGSEQAWLAGALEDRFRIVSPVCGTTTYTDWARMPGDLGVHLSSADPYLMNVLRFTDWPEIGACVAPRPLYILSNSGDNWWPEAGYNKVIATLQKAYGLYGQPERFAHLRDLRSHSLTPYLPELAPWIDRHLKSLPSDTTTPPLPCGEPPADADLNPLRFVQRQILRRAEALPATFASREEWSRYRQSVVQWLRRACVVDEMHLGEAGSQGTATAGGLTMENIAIRQDRGLHLPMTIYKASAAQAGPLPAVILSHAGGQSAACAAVTNLARTLAGDGYLVAVPDHASSQGSSLRPAANLVSLYGAGDASGLSPLAMRVWDDLAALKAVRRRADAGRIALVGLGVGGVDAAVAAAIDEEVAALAAVGAITVRDWAEKVAPNDYHIMPYLPDIMAHTDWQYVYAAALPRPLLIVDDTDRARWPAEAFLRVQRLAAQVASVQVQSAAGNLTFRTASSPGGAEEIRHWLKTTLPPARSDAPPKAPATAAAAVAAPAVNLVANGDFSQGKIGQLPAGWTVSAPNPVLAPNYKLIEGEDGKNLLTIEGNGRKECFGILRHPVELPPGKTYRFRVRFKFEGFEDVNRHLVHAVFTDKNDGIFGYRKEGEWVVGETRLTFSGKGDVRLGFRFSPKGKVWYSEVSLVECEPVEPRLVKLAVTQGGGDRKRWEKFLDTAGQKRCDVALMIEFFNGNHDPQKPEPLDGPSMKFASEKARQWKMYVSGTLLLKRGDLVYNSAPLWNREGQLVGIYDKTMLYDPELDTGTSPGDTMPVFQADFGTVGIMTCYDSWHPSTAKLLALKGAEVILFPSAGYYQQLMHARAADNGVVVAATSEHTPCGVWDGGGNQADGGSPDPTRSASTSIVAFEKDDSQKMHIVTVDLAKKPSPHYWGGPMGSAPGGRCVRTTSPWHLEDEIAREVRRWHNEP